jgi:hypothetical protein
VRDPSRRDRSRRASILVRHLEPGPSALRAPLGRSPAAGGPPLICSCQRLSLLRWALVGPREGASGLVRLHGGMPARGTDLAVARGAGITLVVALRGVPAVDAHQPRRPRRRRISRKMAHISMRSTLGGFSKSHATQHHRCIELLADLPQLLHEKEPAISRKQLPTLGTGRGLRRAVPPAP